MQAAVQRYFEDHAETWDARMPPHYSALLRQFMRPYAVHFMTARMILEVGTGTGALVPVLREIAPEADVIAIDLAYAMLRQASARCQGSWFVQADVQRLPLSANRCDVVVCHNSFPHFPDKRQALRELHRVISPQGQVLILHNNPRPVVNAIHARLGEPIDRDHLPEGSILQAMLIEAGFVSVTVDDGEQHYVARACKP